MSNLYSHLLSSLPVLRILMFCFKIKFGIDFIEFVGRLCTSDIKYFYILYPIPLYAYENKMSISFKRHLNVNFSITILILKLKKIRYYCVETF